MGSIYLLLAVSAYIPTKIALVKLIDFVKFNIFVDFK